MKKIIQIILLFIVTIGHSQSKRIYLTFDDGPSMVMDTTLDILLSKSVKATFFVCGLSCQVFPDIAERAINEGHMIASHSHRHPNHLSISSDSVVSEFNKCNRTLRSVLGVDVIYFRFPQFGYNSTLRSWIKSKGYRDVNATINAKDWDGNNRTATQIREWIISQLNPSLPNVVVLHVSPTPTTSVAYANVRIHTNEALAQLIDECRALGYEFYLLDKTINYDAIGWITPTN